MILCIETATGHCSVALADGGKVVAFAEETAANSHATALTPLIQQVLAAANINTRQLSAVAVSSGPGSYTGLRIGTATAKGIAYANDIPLIAVPTLQALCIGAANTLPNDDATPLTTRSSTLFVGMLDARRMEVYMAAYNHKGEELVPAQPFILDNHDFETYLDDHNLTHYERIIIYGNAVEKTETILLNKKINYLQLNCLSMNMSQIAYMNYTNKKFESLAYFEPNYLKPANITIAKSKV